MTSKIVGIAEDPAADGYWLVGDDGGIFTGGSAPFYGSLGGSKLNKPVVGISATPNGNGYWLASSDGGVFSFGGAKFFGSAGAMTLNAPIVGIAATPTGRGYWLTASDGGVFTFGDAVFHGSMGATRLNSPVVSILGSHDGNGYLLTAADGGIFSFGSASFHGSMADKPLAAPILGGALTSSGKGYYLVASDGGVFTFGDARYLGGATSGSIGTTAGLATRSAGGYSIVGADGRVLRVAATGVSTVEPGGPIIKSASVTEADALYKPFAADSAWNTALPASAKFSSPGTLTDNGPWVNWDSYSAPVYFSHATDPLVTIETAANWRPGETVSIHMPSAAGPAAGTDSNFILVDMSARRVHDFFGVTRVDSNHFKASSYGDSSLDGTGFGQPQATGAWPPAIAGNRVAASSWYGGLITGENVRRGKIEHALAMAVVPSDAANYYVAPAAWWSNNASLYTGKIPVGGRLAIPPGTPRPSGLSAEGNMIFDALTNYGAYMLDYAGSNVIYADPVSVSQTSINALRADWPKIIGLLRLVS